MHNYFAGDAWGIEYFAAINSRSINTLLNPIQPYFMGDRLEYVNGRNYQRIDNGLGISFQLDYGFRVDYEHVFTSQHRQPWRYEPGPSALRLLSGHNSPVARA
ncbi:outer membrane protein [Klebsiella pneumoniae]|uniref:Outer membrane protein n=1 Tax=Klebsiella pneumoniae TaxID=573 RepID=A0A377UYG2_KLEPN|nr:outer membrane protein [Klebsiella pneumoniae]